MAKMKRQNKNKKKTWRIFKSKMLSQSSTQKSKSVLTGQSLLIIRPSNQIPGKSKKLSALRTLFHVWKMLEL